MLDACSRPAAANCEAAAFALTPGTTTRGAAVDAVRSKAPVASSARATTRETLIREALAMRKAREAEWDALTPAQKDRAIAGLGEGMAAIVKTFRAA